MFKEFRDYLVAECELWGADADFGDHANPLLCLAARVALKQGELRDALAASQERERKLREALGVIEQWQLPYAKFEQNHGSNGSRDFIRGVAAAALAETEAGQKSD